MLVSPHSTSLPPFLTALRPPARTGRLRPAARVAGVSEQVVPPKLLSPAAHSLSRLRYRWPAVSRTLTLARTRLCPRSFVHTHSHPLPPVRSPSPLPGFRPRSGPHRSHWRLWFPAVRAVSFRPLAISHALVTRLPCFDAMGSVSTSTSSTALRSPSSAVYFTLFNPLDRATHCSSTPALARRSPCSLGLAPAWPSPRHPRFFGRPANEPG
ncbi:hypothetical protein FS749_002263 [Ceratobasidium sp. UAMH 11750]|nr:hypothetical protein FS749_002263 [Ceratobasidium sp. UAMH 11750]